jgi:hypothetical protein
MSSVQLSLILEKVRPHRPARAPVNERRVVARAP